MPFGRYAGVTLIAGGLAIVVLATVRFIRTTRLLDDPQQHFAKGVRAELFLSAALVCSSRATAFISRSDERRQSLAIELPLAADKGNSSLVAPTCSE